VTGTDPDRLAEALRAASADDGGVDRLAVAARARWSQRFSPEATTAALLDIYDAAREVRPASGRSPR
jgi:glycosyltransferase involved in cell wall biosynthesis